MEKQLLKHKVAGKSIVYNTTILEQPCRQTKEIQAHLYKAGKSFGNPLEILSTMAMILTMSATKPWTGAIAMIMTIPRVVSFGVVVVVGSGLVGSGRVLSFCN